MEKNKMFFKRLAIYLELMKKKKNEPIKREYYIYFEDGSCLKEFDTFENLDKKYYDSIKIEEV
jgi:hypothetical protein